MSSEPAPSPSTKEKEVASGFPDSPPAQGPPRRMGSIDAYRGLVMFLMMAEVLRTCEVARGRARASAGVWEFLCHHQSHVEWIGCVLHDMIQPSFSFLVGVALPFSLASRLARGQSKGLMTAHAVWRSLLLVFLGVFLRSVGRDRTNFTFEDTLSQIGLGYTFLFLLALRPARDQWIAFVLLVVGYWGLFAAYPLPGPDFDYTAVGVPGRLAVPGQAVAGCLEPGQHRLPGRGVRPAVAQEDRVPGPLEQEQRTRPGRSTPGSSTCSRGSEPFRYNGGGYATLSFIPTLATMILGLIAGGVLRREWSAGKKFLWFVVAGRPHPGARLGGRRAGHLPRGQADLDAELGPLLGGDLLPVPGGLLRDHRRPRLGRLVVPPPRHRHELDRRLRPQPPDR